MELAPQPPTPLIFSPAHFAPPSYHRFFISSCPLATVPMSSAVASEPRLEKKAARLRGGSGGAKAPSIAASNAAKLKVVIRKLPPVMTEDEFKEHTAHWDGFDNIEFFSFVKGKVSEEYVPNS